MAATLKDIAAIVGISEPAVSLVLNGRQYHRVSKAMRARIEEVARELDYRPNRQAQLLAGKRTNTVALLVNSLLNQFFAEYLSAVEVELRDASFHTIPFETHSDPKRAEDILGMVDQRICDAVIAIEYTTDPSLAAGRKPDFPLVTRSESLGERHDPATVNVAVWVEYEPAIRHLFMHFKRVGARRIGLLLDSRNDLTRPETERSPRAVAYEKILTSLGLYSGGSQCQSLSQEAELADWAKATEALLTREPEIDCVLVHNALVAPAVLHQLAVMGRRVGRDIAVATYDDTVTTPWLVGGLTVVCEPIPEVSKALVEATLAIIKGDDVPERAPIEAKLIARASSNLEAS
ncbi:MAG: LacI family DNA-binding transcriptional regulator [Phycisphaeraceae bacterium]|nr:MAG: LacI family DNA-binding transcriptional regulator [Phycisphaeraceae bacterium]